MDDSCAVCAETLEWVAYGACGHKDVCSTCVARLRFICDDRRCCICKTESDVVFVTKALGDYTMTISEFSVFPSEAKEGRVGNYWYHEDTQAFFDDLDHFKMIKAMCRLSCSECDKVDQLDDVSRRRAKFKNIEQLKGHLFHKHRLFMCSLCLEGRKNFICEQKLYTRSQLTKHTNTGDSEVDGTESERGGFAGHPRCEFCTTPFYADNELFTHMSTEHYTCHICQRQHPGQYEYYKNYDDLEIHFRRDHCLCEDEECLAKKFIVFQSEAELKRHNTLEHGGRMSRSQRSAALQIPTSFRYRRSSEQDNRRGRGGVSFRRDSSAENELSVAIQASLDASNAAPRTVTNHRDIIDVDMLIPPVESLSTADSDPPSRYLHAVAHVTNATLRETSFPPLPGSTPQNSNPDTAPPKKTIASHLRQKSKQWQKANASSSSPAWPATSRSSTYTHTQPAAINSNAWPSINNASGSSSSRPVAPVRPTPSVTGSSKNSAPPSTKIIHSSSAPNLVSVNSDFPPVSATSTRRSPATDDPQPIVKVKDVQTENKSLVEKMRSALAFDDDKFGAFKVISGEYRQNLMDADTYLSYVEQFGLSHLVPELARLLPNAQKQKELMEAYHVNMVPRENGWGNGIHVKDAKKGKGKGKAVESGNSSVAAENKLADNVIRTMKELHASYRGGSEEEVVAEVLSKDGYRSAAAAAATGGKLKVVSDDNSQLKQLGESRSQSESLSTGVGAVPKNSGKKKKTSKFHRVRLGDGSVQALLDLRNSDPDPDPVSDNGPDSESLPARGVWRNGGGQKLFGGTKK